MQAEKLLALRQKLEKTQEMLQREQHRVQLLEAELLHLRCAQSACLYRKPGGEAILGKVRQPFKDQDSIGQILPSAMHACQHAHEASAVLSTAYFRHINMKDGDIVTGRLDGRTARSLALKEHQSAITKGCA